jgi:hypothetical protein
MNFEKENFLRTRLVPYIQRLDPSTPPLWGKQSVQHMIEHFTEDALRNANSRLKFEKIVTPPEHLQKYKEFLLSDKPFRENTKNPLMGEQPEPLKYKTVQAAIGALQEELIFFFEAYEKDPNLVIRNPIFGDLNFDENVQLLYKHALHHLRQFGINIW